MSEDIYSQLDKQLYRPDATSGNVEQSLEDLSSSGLLAGDYRLTEGQLQSNNFVTGASGSGWRIDAEGNLEANNGNFRGDITGASGTFSGAISGGQLDIGGDDATSAHIDTDGNLWLGASVANKATAPARISNTGSAVFDNVKITGLQSGSSLDGQYLQNSTVVAGKMNVSTLSSITANIGAITAGTVDGVTITGGTVQTSSSGIRTVLDGTDDNVKFMNSSTVYAKIYPSTFPSGGGLFIETNDGATGATISVNYGSAPAADILYNGEGITVGPSGVLVGSKFQLPVGTDLY